MTAGALHPLLVALGIMVAAICFGFLLVVMGVMLGAFWFGLSGGWADMATLLLGAILAWINAL